jgi:hypothetical protein
MNHANTKSINMVLSNMKTPVKANLHYLQFQIYGKCKKQNIWEGGNKAQENKQKELPGKGDKRWLYI